MVLKGDEMLQGLADAADVLQLSDRPREQAHLSLVTSLWHHPVVPTASE